MGEVLGLIQETPERFWDRKKERWLHRQGLSEQDVAELVRRRNLARSERRWDEADRIRNELSEKGIALEDTPGGTLWKVR